MKKKVAIGAVLLVVLSVVGILLFCDLTPCLKVRAVLGSTSAMISLAENLENADKQYDAMKWYEKAAKAGNTAAYTPYGRLLIELKFEDPDAVSWAERGFAETGHVDVDSAFFLGKHLYSKGNGEFPRPDLKKKGVAYLEMAVDELEKKGREKDFIETAFLLALYYYPNALNNSVCGKTVYWTEKILKKKFIRQHPYWSDSFGYRYDICNAYYYAGLIYKAGSCGVKKDEKKGTNYLIRAAEGPACQSDLEAEMMKLNYSGGLGDSKRSLVLEYFYDWVVDRRYANKYINKTDVEQIAFSCDGELILFSKNLTSYLEAPSKFDGVLMKLANGNGKNPRAYFEYYASGFHKNEVKLDPLEWQKIRNTMEEIGFWDMPTIPYMIGVEGASTSMFALSCNKIQYLWGHSLPELKPLEKQFLDIIEKSAKQGTVSN